MRVLSTAQKFAADLKPKSFLTAVFGALALCISLGTGAQAAVIHVVDGFGQLTGAQNVDLGDLGFFNVTFVEGSCNSIFDGCDNNALDFHTLDDATVAVNALLDQVFVDTVAGQFDSDPSLTFGCDGTNNNCQTYVGFHSSPSNSQFSVMRSVNHIEESLDRIIGPGSRTKSLDTGTDGLNVYARFSSAELAPVPVPAALPLFLSAMAGLGFAGWRRQRRAV